LTNKKWERKNKALGNYPPISSEKINNTRKKRKEEERVEEKQSLKRGKTLGGRG